MIFSKTVAATAALCATSLVLSKTHCGTAETTATQLNNDSTAPLAAPTREAADGATPMGSATPRGLAASQDGTMPVEWYVKMLKSMDSVSKERLPESMADASMSSPMLGGMSADSGVLGVVGAPGAVAQSLAQSLTSLGGSVNPWTSSQTRPSFLSALPTGASAVGSVPQHLSSALSTADMYAALSQISANTQGSKVPEGLIPGLSSADSDLFALLSQGLEAKTKGVISPEDLAKVFKGSEPPRPVPQIANSHQMSQWMRGGAPADNSAATRGFLPQRGITGEFTKFIDFFGNPAAFDLFKQVFINDQVGATKFLSLFFGTPN